jgi:hypothetical protein
MSKEDLSTSDEEEALSSALVTPRSELTTPRDDTMSPRDVGSPKKRVVRKKVVKRKKKGGTVRKSSSTERRSRSSSISAADVEKVENTPDATPTATPTKATPVNTHEALVCPTCKKHDFESSIELTRHLETHQESPFPGIKVRHRGSILLNERERPKELGKEKTKTVKTQEGNNDVALEEHPRIKLPPLAVYTKGDYFNWV